MITPPNFTPGKKYALDGATLQALFDAVATCQILRSDEYELEVTPKKGTRLTDIKAKNPREIPWDLKAAPGGLWDLIPGSVTFIGIGVDQSIEITNTTNLSLAPGKVLYLEITEEVPESIAVKVENDWADFPTPYQYDYNAETYTHTFLGYRFPLWQFVDDPAADPRLTKISNFYGKQLCTSDLQLAFAIWEKRNADTGEVEIPPVGAPYFKLAPAAMIQE